MESLFLPKTYSINKLYRSLPESSSSLTNHDSSRLRLGRTNCSSQNSSSDNLYASSNSSSSSPAPPLSKMKKNTASATRAVSSEIVTDYAVVTHKTSPVAKPASRGEDHGIGIAQYLHGKNYFITGATGFLAKVFIEKMLRTTPTVGKIYLLIKAQDKAAAMERLQNEIIDCELFMCLKQLRGESYQNFMMSKLVPVAGNVCEANLAMDSDVMAETANEVEVIVNSAANTCFDERYDVALNTNTKGPCRLLSFAKLCKKLQVFMHVSTAYVNGEREGVVLEKPFWMGDSIAAERAARCDAERCSIPVLDIEAEIKLASSVAGSTDEYDSSCCQRMRELGLQRAKAYGWQNTYVFTKAMGEMMLNSMRGDIPVVIIRPSVIESISKEPLPGWIQGNRMLDPLILNYGKGQLPGFSMDPQAVIDVVPADMVANATLAAMAKHGKQGKKPGLSIYHVSSAPVNPLVLDDVFNYSHEHFTNSPLHDVRGNRIELERMRYFSSAEDFSSYYIQDITTRRELLAPTPRNLSESRLQIRCKRKVEHFFHLAKIYEPYMFYRGRFDNSNTENLMEEMSIEEQMKFGFDLRNIDWEDYFLNVHIPGLRRHVLRK